MCAIKKLKVETYNCIIDISLSERFKTNIRPLKDLSLLSSRRVWEVQKNLYIVPCDTFEALCSMYTQVDRDALLTEYKEFCNNFTEIENSSVIPKYLHEKEHLIIEDETYEDSLDLNSNDYNDNMMEDSI